MSNLCYLISATSLEADNLTMSFDRWGYGNSHELGLRNVESDSLHLMQCPLSNCPVPGRLVSEVGCSPMASSICGYRISFCLDRAQQTTPN